jgi:uncharacterized BrkB/YihY/UPF0761 family membrane protein
MRAPTGSVVGLCSASATMSAMGMAFLGYWGVHEPTPWNTRDVAVVCLALLSFMALGAAIWIATTPVPEDAVERIVPARRSFAAGLILMWLGMVLAIWH